MAVAVKLLVMHHY